MEKIDEQLNNLSLVEIPAGIHQSVMRKVHYQKIRPILLTSFVFLTLIFAAVIWNINAKLVDAEFIDMTQDFFEIFNFNLSFLSTTLGNFFEIISPALFLSAVFSLAGAVYVGKKMSNLYRLSTII